MPNELSKEFFQNIADGCVRVFARAGWHSSYLELIDDVESVLRRLAARERKNLQLEEQIEQLKAEIEELRHAE